MQLFYTPNPKSNILDGEEFYHCVKSLRKKVGDIIFTTDGKGNLFKTKIEKIEKKSCYLEKKEKIKSLTQNKINHISISLIKSQNRIDWMVEKLTEIGVNEITFILSQNCERKRLNYERLNKKLISAAKQCNSLFLPKINPIISLDQFLLNTKNKDNKFFADLESKNKLNKCGDNINSLLIIGPEGDFTNEEKEKIKQSGYNGISLGNQILRSETAAVVGGYLLSEN